MKEGWGGKERDKGMCILFSVPSSGMTGEKNVAETDQWKVHSARGRDEGGGSKNL